MSHTAVTTNEQATGERVRERAAGQAVMMIGQANTKVREAWVTEEGMQAMAWSEQAMQAMARAGSSHPGH
jgi:hypothetical protein